VQREISDKILELVHANAPSVEKASELHSNFEHELSIRVAFIPPKQPVTMQNKLNAILATSNIGKYEIWQKAPMEIKSI
jgi:hypothetical protein